MSVVRSQERSHSLQNAITMAGRARLEESTDEYNGFTNDQVVKSDIEDCHTPFPVTCQVLLPFKFHIQWPLNCEISSPEI